MNRIERTSYILIASILVVVGWAELGTPFVTILFSYLALSLLYYLLPRPWAVVSIFTVLVIAIFYGFIHFAHHAITTLPEVAKSSVPLIVDYAKAHNLDFLLPFDDWESLKSLVVDNMMGDLASVVNSTKVATKEFVFMIIGLVIAASLFLNGELDLDRERYLNKNNLYSALCAASAARFVTFYKSFAMVMGAQLIISLINTSFTSLFVLIGGVPHAMILIVTTFLCGMLPIIGNLISNTIIFCVSITMSVNMAFWALVFLIALHKFEYFLNSKIIGSRIRNPMWLTLLGLVVGEKLIGIPGMILAPVVLHYIKVEASCIEC